MHVKGAGLEAKGGYSALSRSYISTIRCFNFIVLSIPSGPSISGELPNSTFFKIGLAVDYDSNGYRGLLPFAMNDISVMNAMLAVAASHYSRWQNTTDVESQNYLKNSISGLQEKIRIPAKAREPTTILCMLLLVTHEIFAGSIRCIEHYNAIRRWVESQDCSNISPFVKTWICMLDIQSALNTGNPILRELHGWLNEPFTPADEETVFIDPLFGCRVDLLKTLSAASELFSKIEKGKELSREAFFELQSLQRRIKATQIKDSTKPLLQVVCHGETGRTYDPISLGLNTWEITTRVVATAEIYRHAAHIYVHRIAYDLTERALDSSISSSVSEALRLLTLVPDAIGPGAGLGWCLVVIGSEIDSQDQRKYIRSRFHMLHSLGVNSTRSAERVLEEVWNQRDMELRGDIQRLVRYQDAMRELGELHVLV
ncbi:hypothetical protein N7456_005961 [Penicillium angulare]|uniref:Zn(II)2Cys6 transcription factor n=1 Tax=Penicillium angulare TaxID=116970 RepID=A0A9W9FZE4_9EURO|nr:hypothetical protein N7456_005961 [Penicillium angulare]